MGKEIVSDNVLNPIHYTSGKIDCLDAIESALGNYGFQQFLRGQIMKYIWRMDKKGEYLEDAEKAQFYLNRLVASIKEDLNDNGDGETEDK